MTFFTCIRILLGASILLTACKSKKPPTRSEQMAPVWDPNVQVGSYYRLKGMATQFYDRVPDKLINATPKLLGWRHVVQLLDPDAGGGWARVRSEEGDLGFVRFEEINIVPFEEQPEAPKPKREYWDE